MRAIRARRRRIRWETMGSDDGGGELGREHGADEGSGRMDGAGDSGGGEEQREDDEDDGRETRLCIDAEDQLRFFTG